jgi:hypothetical protein
MAWTDNVGMQTQFPARQVSGTNLDGFSGLRYCDAVSDKSGFRSKTHECGVYDYVHEVSSGAREEPPHAGSPSAPE